MLRKQRGAIALAFLGIVIRPVTAGTVFLARPAETGGLVSRIGNIEGAARVAVSESGSRVAILAGEGRVWEWHAGKDPSWILVEGVEQTAEIAVGVSHTVVRRDNGTVWTWGSNREGQLGDGTLKSSARPVRVEPLARKIAAGPNYSLLLDAAGQVWVWGGNWRGIAPGNADKTLTRPTRVEGLPAMESIAVRGNQPFAIDHQGALWTWGKFPDTREQDAPAVVDPGSPGSPLALLAQELRQASDIETVTLAGIRWWPGVAQPDRLIQSGADSVIVGDRTTVLPGWRRRIAAAAGWAIVWITGTAETSNRSILRAGAREQPGRTTDREPVAFSLSATSAIVGAGSGTGSLDLSVPSSTEYWSLTSTSIWLVPTPWSGYGSAKIAYSYTSNPTSEPRTAQLTFAGQTFTLTQVGVVLLPGSLAVPAAGVTNRPIEIVVKPSSFPWTATSLTSWISIRSGSSGTGNGSLSIDVAPNPDLGIRSGFIRAGGQTLGIRQSGTVAAIPAFTAIAAGNGYSLGRRGDGSLMIRGAPLFTEYEPVLTLPTDLQGVSKAVSISAGHSHLLAAVEDGRVWTQGRNDQYLLGLPLAASAPNSGYVPGLSQITAVAAGNDHSLALKANGTVLAWGYNHQGALGDGTQESRSSPVPVPVQGLSGVVALAVGEQLSVALRSDGTVWTWGQYRPPASPPASGSLVPVRVNGLDNVRAVAAGGRSVYAVRQDGTVWAWGANIVGQLGDGTTTDRQTPVQVLNLTGVAAVTAGNGFAGALRSDGTVWTWGFNLSGQLGDGTLTGRKTPAPVPGLSGVSAISASSSYMLALTQDGRILGWGQNSWGEFHVVNGQFPAPIEAVFPLLAFSPPAALARPLGGNGSATAIVAPEITPWTLKSADWLSLQSFNGNGSTVINYTVLGNLAAASRTGTITLGTATYTVTQAGVAITPTTDVVPASGASSRVISVTMSPQDAPWTAIATENWITLETASGAGSGVLLYDVDRNPSLQSRAGAITVEGRGILITQAGANISFYTLDRFGPAPGEYRVTVQTASTTYPWTVESRANWIQILTTASNTGSQEVAVRLSANTTGRTRTGTILIDGQPLSLIQEGKPLRLVAVTPCRVADTRPGEGKTGSFGPPALEAGTTRKLPIASGACGIPSTAKAYSLNFTVVPQGPLSFLSAWPGGESQPVVSTLNSFDGKVTANAAIVPAGPDGSINVYATGRTDLIVDINGYFVE